jgi:hypothetical protein
MSRSRNRRRGLSRLGVIKRLAHRPATGSRICVQMHGQSLCVSANELIAPAVRPAYWSMTLNLYSRIAKIIAMPRGSTPGERRGGHQKGPPNKTVVAKAVHILAAAGATAKAPSVSTYVRLFELAEDYDRELARAERPQNQAEVVECREWLARILKGLLACEKPRLTTTQVHDDKDCPVSTCQRSPTASWRSCGHRTQGRVDDARRDIRSTAPCAALALTPADTSSGSPGFPACPVVARAAIEVPAAGDRARLKATDIF